MCGCAWTKPGAFVPFRSPRAAVSVSRSLVSRRPSFDCIRSPLPSRTAGRRGPRGGLPRKSASRRGRRRSLRLLRRREGRSGERTFPSPSLRLPATSYGGPLRLATQVKREPKGPSSERNTSRRAGRPRRTQSTNGARGTAHRGRETETTVTINDWLGFRPSSPVLSSAPRQLPARRQGSQRGVIAIHWGRFRGRDPEGFI